LLLLRIGTIVFVVTVARCSFIFHSCTDHKCLLHIRPKTYSDKTYNKQTFEVLQVKIHPDLFMRAHILAAFKIVFSSLEKTLASN